MRALVKSRPEPGIWLEDVSPPKIGPNDLLVRVRYTSICGTDLHIWNWDAWAQKTIPVPLVIGHEFEGSVAEMGSEVSGLPEISRERRLASLPMPVGSEVSFSLPRISRCSSWARASSAGRGRSC